MASSNYRLGWWRTDAIAALGLWLCAATLLAANNPALIAAIQAGNETAIAAHLSEHAQAQADGTTALHWAVRTDNLPIVRSLLKAGADANAANRYGVTPLYLAVTNGDTDIANALFEAGANVNATLPEGETMLMTAARTGNAGIIRTLLEHGADVAARESFYGETALMWAASENHAEAVEELLNGGAEIDQRSAHIEMARRGAGLSDRSLGEWTPLMYAARDGATDAARVLMRRGADLNLTDPDGTTALAYATINYHYDLAAEILAAGADPNIADKTGMNALYAAIDMHTLPEMFGRPEQKPDSVKTALDLVKLMLEAGADPNARITAVLMKRAHTDGDPVLGPGATAFMRAARAGDTAVMNLLLDHGADPNLLLENGNTALMVAAGLGWRDGNMAVPIRDVGTEQEAIAAIQICLDHGADINHAGARGDTALHDAVTGRGSLEIIRFLVEKGAKLDVMNERGQTPLDAAMASRRDRSAAAALLRELMER